MRRADFFKALAVLPFAPALLERLKPVSGERLIHYRINGIEYAKPPADASWVVEFAGATFVLDDWGVQAQAASTPFECRLGVDHLRNGWKRLWVNREGKAYSTYVQKGADDVPDSAWFQGMSNGEAYNWTSPAPDWWPRRIR